MSFSRFQLTATALALGASCLFPTAHAGEFEATAFADLIVQDVTASSLDGLSFSVVVDEVVVFGGLASADSFARGQGGEGGDIFGLDIAVETVIYGSADGDADSEASAFVEIVNGTGGDVAIDFKYVFDIEAFADLNPALAGSDAVADSFFALVSNLAGVDLFEVAEADAVFGPIFSPAFDDGSFTINLAPEQSAVIDLVVGSFGFAEGVQVPAPPVAILVGIGLLAFGSRYLTPASPEQ